MYKIGDVSFVRGTGKLSDAIVWFQRLRDRPSWNPFILGDDSPSHVMVHDSENFVVEALIERGIARNPISIHANEGLETFRPTFLTQIIKRNMYIMLDLMVGQMYGYGKIPLLALDGLFRTYWFTQVFGITNFKVCVHVAGWVYFKVPIVETDIATLNRIVKGEYDHPQQLGYQFANTKWQNLNVDTVQDFVIANAGWNRVE